MAATLIGTAHEDDDDDCMARDKDEDPHSTGTKAIAVNEIIFSTVERYFCFAKMRTLCDDHTNSKDIVPRHVPCSKT